MSTLPPRYKERTIALATPNYGYEKRQRELAKKQKKEEKARAKAAGRQNEPGQGGDDAQPTADDAQPSGAADGTAGDVSGA